MTFDGRFVILAKMSERSFILKSYTTVKEFGVDEYIEKKSRFICYCKPVRTQEEADAFVAEIRSKHWDARHNVYAYVLAENNIMRCSDDGEPQGTAGVPVLDAIRKSGIVDAVVVITRYFGGILLGTGGLVRAYSHSSSLALAAAQPIVMVPCTDCSVSCSYSRYGKISALVPACGGVIDDTVFDDNAHISFHIETQKLTDFNKQLADATCGEVSADIGDERYYESVI